MKINKITILIKFYFNLIIILNLKLYKSYLLIAIILKNKNIY